jgi:hypothetical protein
VNKEDGNPVEANNNSLERLVSNQAKGVSSQRAGMVNNSYLNSLESMLKDNNNNQ